MPKTMGQSPMGLDESYGDPAPEAPEGEDGIKKPESVDEENAGADEILVAKDKLGDGVKVGDQCTFEITQDFGDEMALKYRKEGDESKGDQAEMGPEEAELNAMSEAPMKG